MIFVNNDTVMGSNIRYLRQKSGISLQDFARRMNIDPDILDSIETGKLLEIEGQVLLDICDFFSTDAQTLVEKICE